MTQRCISHFRLCHECGCKYLKKMKESHALRCEDSILLWKCPKCMEAFEEEDREDHYIICDKNYVHSIKEEDTPLYRQLETKMVIPTSWQEAWQEEAEECTNEQKSITFFVDRKGKSGKSYLKEKMMREKKAIYVPSRIWNCKIVDLKKTAESLTKGKEYPKCYLFDLANSVGPSLSKKISSFIMWIRENTEASVLVLTRREDLYTECREMLDGYNVKHEDCTYT